MHPLSSLGSFLTRQMTVCVILCCSLYLQKAFQKNAMCLCLQTLVYLNLKGHLNQWDPFNIMTVCLIYYIPVHSVHNSSFLKSMFYCFIKSIVKFAVVLVSKQIWYISLMDLNRQMMILCRIILFYEVKLVMFMAESCHDH